MCYPKWKGQGEDVHIFSGFVFDSPNEYFTEKFGFFSETKNDSLSDI